ncbi:hypothetical protein NP233_g11456 [Leucocoprinus birnbaumii]|uniref:Uncharacterized protein n=1 Tax=Leucocoprinus birnbaumii TaxID=56174 RepID=A0AAD5YQX9_9AGAR|nr:hypothetical protein NP233_g11456 [Leucocoprinus birnbaumii]
MLDGSFTVSEFIELLIASILAGLLTGCLLIYIYRRYQRRRAHSLRRQEDFDGETKAHQGKSPPSSNNAHLDLGSVIDIHSRTQRSQHRQTPSIPIQPPPAEEDPSSYAADDLAVEMTANNHWAEAGSSRVGRLETDVLHDNPRTPGQSQMVSFPSTPSTLEHQLNTHASSGSTSARHSRFPSHTRLRGSGHGSQGGNSTSSVGQSSADLALSRTTTNVSTLPAYDTLSNAPPRYPSSLRTSISHSVILDQPSPGFIPPLPETPRWTKQDGSDRF